MVRLSVLLSVALSLVANGAGGVGVASAYAQPRPQVQLPDADGDGHPLFGNPQIRPGFEERPGDATSVVFADLDGDGDLDAAVTNTGRVSVSYITVLINRGDGVFDPPVAYDAGAEPIHIVAADLDGDGFPDLAVVNATSNDVSVFINNGDGTFAPDVKYDVGRMPRSLVSEDFDDDGDNDIATLNTITHDVSILLNKGDGLFEPERRVFVGSVTQIVTSVNRYPGPQIACGDLNGDGIADLAVPANGRIKLLFGDGNGLFLLANQHASVPSRAYAVVMGDLDGDGDNDLATVASAELGGEALSVLLNTGGGVFGPATTYSVATQPSPTALYEMFSLALGDLEGDGDLDIALGYEGRQLVSIFRNNGDGLFAPKETHPVHPGPWFVAWADVNGDGATDLAVLATGIRSKLAILLNAGDGALITQEETPPRFEVRTTYPWFNPTSVAAADLDGDGDQDVVVSIGSSSEQVSVIVMHNDGTGVFDPIVPYPLGPVGASSAEHVVIANFNDDGFPDLAIVDTIDQGGWNREGKVWILLGQASGSFAAPTPFVISGLVPTFVAVGDLDGDHDQDLIVWTAGFPAAIYTTPVGRAAVVLLNDGNGVFTESARYDLGSLTWNVGGSVALGDFDNDGDLDFVGAACSSVLVTGLEPPGLVTFYLNDGNGIFTKLTERVMNRPRGLTIADFDNDGSYDVAVLSPNLTVFGLPCLNILYGLGGGAFSDPVPQVGKHLSSNRITHEDIDRDGDIDLIVTNDYGTVSVILNGGHGTFDRGAHYGAGDLPKDAALADLDGDGRIDIVTSNLISHNVTLLRNLGSPGCYADCDKSSGTGVLDMLDFLCFQTAFTNADPYACDCDTSTGPGGGNGVCDIFDFLCFQNAFVSGCP